MKKLFALSALLVVFVCLASRLEAQGNADYHVVPLPHEIKAQGGSPFVLNAKSRIFYAADNARMRQNAEFLSEYIEQHTGFKLRKRTGKPSGNAIVLQVGLVSDNAEAYRIEVSRGTITITGASEAGVFYGIQTLRKSMPMSGAGFVTFPAVVINDAPRFSYRGMMLDVARHMFSVDEVKTFIDMLVLHNINTFHWHLTEDQGWRIEIKKYPRLTEIGSQRKETVIGRNNGQYDGKPYGGFYTQDEIREVIGYATKRYINVIPEIDMPGHMLAALAAYPELGCTGGPYEVWTQWGISDDVLCAGNDKTYEFVKDVLTEVMDLFPSEFIHIGGDECPKVRWEQCPKCQARINELGLVADEAHTAEERLQSYFINFAEKVINDRGRRMIGWDEILEGGLAPNATVMSWRGMAGGIEAAQLGHDVVMTPNSHLYFDYYQSTDVERDPLAIGGYLPISRVYELEPVPAVLTEAQRKHIIGVQANLWTEYVPLFSHVQFMVLPRMAALSEVQWMQSDKKNYDDFLTRLPALIKVYQALGYNYAKHLFDVRAEFTPNAEEGTIEVVLETLANDHIYYTLDGSTPNRNSSRFDGVIKISSDAVLKAITYYRGEESRVFSENVIFNKATTKPITALQPVNEQYKYEGISTLVDGLRGNSNYRTGRWIAFRGNDMEVVIDLKEATAISETSVSTCVVKGDWIFDLREFMVMVSDNGRDFTSVANMKLPAMAQSDKDGVKNYVLKYEPVNARYVKVLVKPEHSMPEWHGGKGLPAFLFVDEVVIR